MHENNFEKMVNRVDTLRDSDNPYEDSISKLAEQENQFRKKLIDSGLNEKEAIDFLANEFSNEVLEKMEAEKDKYLDALTGFQNKTSLLDNIPKLLDFEKRNKKDCSVLMIDLDYFKSVNDNYGHETGDLILKKITEVIKSSLRQSDFAFRYGGEEFVVFIMNSDVKDAVILAERIRQAVEETEIIFKNGNKDNISIKKTISIGCADTNDVAEWKKKQKNININAVMEELIDRADKALYESKEGGRNKVTLFEDLKNRDKKLKKK